MARSTRTRSANEPSSEHCLFLVRSGNHTHPLARDHSRKNALEIAAGEHCYATPHSSGAAPQHNSEQREALADSISHKLHPMVEQYAQLFKTGIRTPVLKRPSDIGLDYEDVFFPSLDGIPLEA